MPFAGECAICGSNDKRHRVIDAMCGAVRAGDDPYAVAEDYGYSETFIRRLTKEQIA